MKRLAIALSALAFAGLTMGQESCSESLEEEEPTVEGGSGESKKTASIGDRMTLKGTTYQVKKRPEVVQELGDQYTKVKANGVFVAVDVCLTNRKNEPATILDDNMRLIGGNGKSYSTSDDALFALDDQSFLLEEIQPDVTECGKLVYDLPGPAVGDAKLQVSDLFSDSTGEIRLGI